MHLHLSQVGESMVRVYSKILGLFYEYTLDIFPRPLKHKRVYSVQNVSLNIAQSFKVQSNLDSFHIHFG